MNGNIEREKRIQAAGIVQSVIASGAPIEEWSNRSAYGLALTKYWAARLSGFEAAQPPIPTSLQKEHVNG